MNFLFLEVTDPEINCLLNRLRYELTGKTHNTNIHITVRGPLKIRASEDESSKWKRVLKNEPVLIANPGIFRNEGVYVVYLGINSKHLRSIWYKPDFPVKTFGFNPHISMYVGKNEQYAEEILKFLKKERVELITTHYEITAYTSKQEDLFAESPPPESTIIRLYETGRVRPQIVERARNLRLKFYPETPN